MSTSAKCHIFSISLPVLNVQVLSLPHFYWLQLCILTQRSWQLFITLVHSRSSHWFVLTPETLITPGFTPFQLMARPQFQAELVSAWFCCFHHPKPVGMWVCWVYMLKSAGSLQSTHQICGSPAAKICNHNPHGLQRGGEIVLEKLKIKSELHL